MKIQFYIRFYTQPGESLAVVGNIEQLGNGDLQKAFLLDYLDKEFWQGSIDVDPNAIAKIHYSYVFQNESGDREPEGGRERVVDISKTGLEQLRLIDSWNDAGDYGNVFFTDPFQQALLKENTGKTKSKSPKTFTHIFKVQAPLLGKHEAVCLLGNSPVTGNWDITDPLILHLENEWWSIKLNLPSAVFPLQYKYGIYNARDKTFVAYESGGNRSLSDDSVDKKITIVHDGFVRIDHSTWKGAGVSIPVFSLKSKDSFGIGEFQDLRLLADWARKTGLKMIQLLPVNDTTASNTWTDSYPYAAISAFALHPIYINLEAIAGKHQGHVIKSLHKKKKQLNDLPEVDYEQVIRFKLSIAHELFMGQKEKFLEDEGFLLFFEENKHWLAPYSAFCYLRDRNGTADFTKWKLYSEYNRASIGKYVSPKAKHYDSIAFNYFLQYHLHLQLKEAVDYAHKNGVIIKGDMPIGVFRFSCDVWMNPSLFNMELQSGAPPDSFAVKGQNWGFPTYNWERMANNHFDWWHKRFVQMGHYFDAFRIDHILGFFRMWSIPLESTQGIMGYFVPALPVHVYEFAQRGMWFNYHRFCKPYITDDVLWELFGPNKEKFIPFLVSYGNHQYQLKEAFSAQAQIIEYFRQLENTEENQRICDGLLDLVSNVILFEQQGSGGQEFHFRISMDQTSSFRRLDENMQHQLRALYVDYFYRRQDAFWKKEAMKKLPALKRATPMLICGEDLGMVPHSVPEVMKKLGILSLEIQRMPKNPWIEFFHPSHAPYLSVVSPSTHDMSTIRGWWEEDRGKTQRFYNELLGQSGEAPLSCPGWINAAIVQQHLESPAMWCVFQLQDLLGMDERLRRENPNDERINVPAHSQFYWRYRMHLTLEQLLKEKQFNEGLYNHIEASGRG